VTEFLVSAAYDPNVLAIKQTLYRTAGDSPIIDALVTAAEQGKQVTAVVELKARFDEKNNIVWARQLERAGVHVVFGFIGLKTHAKMTLIVRRERGKLQSYAHTSSGNYNSTTARFYTDMGIFTADPGFTSDVANIFNLITGFNAAGGANILDKIKMLPPMKKIAVAPFHLREFFIKLIDDEIECVRKHGSGLIMAKCNALVDQQIIDKLYEASQAGVKIELMIRGICCLRPGIKGLSENIEVRSIVDRFLEHTRLFYFQAAGEHKVYVGSADWMPRNLDRRIEILFPIEDREIKERVIQEVLRLYWRDNVKVRTLQLDGTYKLAKRGSAEPVRAQERLIDLAREAGVKSIPYDAAIRYNPRKKKGRPVARPKKR
jgi:polyphosphate kinase